MKLCVIESHPIQYHAPVWRALARDHALDVTVIYASDHSVRGYLDEEFGVHFAWDTDLLAGYRAVFLRERDEVTGSLREALARASADAVLSVGYSSRFHLEGIRCARSEGLPILFRAETTDRARSRSLLRRVVRDGALRLLYSRCAALLYIGEASKAHYERLGVPSERLFFSPYCVDESVFQASESGRVVLRGRTRGELGIAEEDFVVLFSGKLSTRKGVVLLLEAADAMARDASRGRVWTLFVGAGELEPLLRNCAENLSCRSVFAGFRKQSELSRFFHAADCLVLPSLWGETWGLVVNEALLHGLPVVVSDAVGCHPDLVIPGGTGEVVPRGDAGALAWALERVRAAGSSEEGRERRRRKAAEYSTARAAAGVAEALASVIPAVA